MCGKPKREGGKKKSYGFTRATATKAITTQQFHGMFIPPPGSPAVQKLHTHSDTFSMHSSPNTLFSDSSSGFNTCFVKHSKWNMIFHLCLRSVIDRFKSISKSVGQLEYHSTIVFLHPQGFPVFYFFTCVQHMCGFSSTRVFVCVFEAPACAMLMTHLHYKRVELFLCL